MKKIKRPYKRINKSYGGRVKKPYVEDGICVKVKKTDLLDLF